MSSPLGVVRFHSKSYSIVSVHILYIILYAHHTNTVPISAIVNNRNKIHTMPHQALAWPLRAMAILCFRHPNPGFEIPTIARTASGQTQPRRLATYTAARFPVPATADWQPIYGSSVLPAIH